MGQDESSRNKIRGKQESDFQGQFPLSGDPAGEYDLMQRGSPFPLIPRRQFLFHFVNWEQSEKKKKKKAKQTNC